MQSSSGKRKNIYPIDASFESAKKAKPSSSSRGSIDEKYSFPTTYKKINITYHHYQFEMTPCELIHTSDIDNVIIIYYIKMTNTRENINMTAKIPYYLSDGYTNYFKANLILPFICFNDNNRYIDGAVGYSKTTIGDCLYVHDNTNNKMIVKLNQYNCSINMKGITENAYPFYINVHSMGDHKAISYSDYLTTINKYATTREGLKSVLVRMQNLVDFYIGTSLMGQQYADYMCVPTHDKKYVMGSGTRYGAEKHNTNIYDEIFRKNIYTEIIKLRGVLNLCVVHNGDDNSDIQMEVKTMTSTEFNRYYAICKKTDVYKNIRDYVNISKVLHFCIDQYIHHKPDKKEPDHIISYLKKYINKYNNIKEPDRDQFLKERSTNPDQPMVCKDLRDTVEKIGLCDDVDAKQNGGDKKYSEKYNTNKLRYSGLNLLK